jgi:transporter family protein
MRYVAWALLALLSYSAVPPLMRYVTQEIPSDVAVVVTNGMLTVGAIGLVVATDKPFFPALTHQRAPAMYLGGIALAVGIVAFYRALSAGPVSVVVPIFGLFIATSSVVGFLVLDEPLTLRKGLGITLALLAVYLTAVE